MDCGDADYVDPARQVRASELVYDVLDPEQDLDRGDCQRRCIWGLTHDTGIFPVFLYLSSDHGQYGGRVDVAMVLTVRYSD